MFKKVTKADIKKQSVFKCKRFYGYLNVLTYWGTVLLC